MQRKTNAGQILWTGGGGSDPQYISHWEINWNLISKAIKKISIKNNFQGIGLLNFNKRETDNWKHLIPIAEHISLHLDHAQRNVTWDSLYPEWIDEEQEDEVPICMSLPMLDVPRKRLDLIAVKLPCRDEGNWSRDVARCTCSCSDSSLCRGLSPSAFASCHWMLSHS